MIVVLDTNVWISGLQFATRYGIPTRAIERAMSRDVIEEEIYRVLTEKFHWEPIRVHAAFQIVLARAMRLRLERTVRVCRDPKDDIFLECAATARADILVAGDKDLLVLGAFQGTRIVTPAEYVGMS